MESIELLRLLDEIKKLSSQLEELKSNQVKPKQERRSSQINDLAAALAKAQSEFKVARKDKENPYFKSSYADWESVAMASMPFLNKQNIGIEFDFEFDETGAQFLVCRLTHSSGQFSESIIRFVPPKTDAQTIASYNTYMKRMLYTNKVGVVIGDEDDDAEVAMVPTRDNFSKGTSLNHKYNPIKESPEVISKDLLEELNYELTEYPDLCEMVLEGLKIQTLADMPKNKFMPSITRIREIKALRNGNK